MGLLDSMRARLVPAKDKVSDLARRHGGKVQHGLDKAAAAVDERTGGKYSDRIRAGTGRAKEAVDRLAQKDGPATGGPVTPPGPPQGPSPAS